MHGASKKVNLSSEDLRQGTGREEEREWCEDEDLRRLLCFFVFLHSFLLLFPKLSWLAEKCDWVVIGPFSEQYGP